MSKEIIDIAALEGLAEWKVAARHLHERDRNSVLLQSIDHPEIGIWTYLSDHGTRTRVNIPGQQEVSAVCVCSSCWPSVEHAACFISENADELGMRHVLTRHCSDDGRMHEPDEVICRLFGWSHDWRWGCGWLELR